MEGEGGGGRKRRNTSLDYKITPRCKVTDEVICTCMQILTAGEHEA